MSKKPLFIQWCAKDALMGTEHMPNDVELAYRRLMDHIYVADGKLIDDDRILARITKMDRKWKGIKATLLRLSKIEVRDGYIYNERCTKELSEARSRSAHAKGAAETRHNQPKSLKTNNTGDARADAQAHAHPNAQDDAQLSTRTGAQGDAQEAFGHMLTVNHKPLTEGTNVPSGAAAPARTPEQQVFDLGKLLLGKKSGGGQVTKLRKALAYDDTRALEVLTEAKAKSSPSEYIAKIINNAAVAVNVARDAEDEIYRGVR